MKEFFLKDPVLRTKVSDILGQYDFVFVDIDNTIVSSGQADASSIPPSIRDFFNYRPELLAKFYLCSNGGKHERNDAIAKTLKVKYIRGRAKKPFKGALGDLDIKGKRVLLIGDKYLTDGLLALSVGADFIKTKTWREGKESLYGNFALLVDAWLGHFIYFCLSLLRPARSAHQA